MSEAYYEGFDDVADIARQFDAEIGDIDVIVAYYSYEDYSGDALVLFRQDGKLYEVNGSHCSCNGLEGQWDPEETTIEAVQARVPHSYGMSGKVKARVASLAEESK